MDVPSLIVVAALGVLIARSWWWRGYHAPELEEQRDPLPELAERLRLPESARDGEGRLEFQRDGFSVELNAEAGRRFHVRVATRDRLPGWLHVVPRRDHRARPSGTVKTHDPFLDDAFWTVGAPRAVTAVLRHPVRAGLLSLRNVTIQPGSVESRCTTSRLIHVERWLDGVLTVVHQLADPPDDYDEALLSVLIEEPYAKLRLHALQLLAEPDVDASYRQEALATGLADPDPEVRCFAALRTDGATGVAELQGIAGGYEIPEDVRLSAFHGLLRIKAGADLVPLMVLAATGPEGRLSRRALGWAVAYGGDDALKEIAGKPRLPLQTLAIVVDIARRRRASVIAPALLDMLEWHWASDDRRRLALKGLGGVATVHAVPALKRVAAQDGALAPAARAAVLEIQERCQGDTAGALSLADDGHGQVAVVEAGGLGFSDDAR